MFVIEIIEPVLTFQQKTAEEMLRKLNTAIKKSVPNIRTNARSATLNFLRNSREYQSLVGGKLMGHFGLPHDEATRMVEGIIGTIAENLQVSHTIPVGAARFRTAGDLEISVVEADFSDILSLPEALIYTDKGEILPWLEWLLTAGDRILINTHRVILGDFSNSKFRSRSKKGLMIQAKGTHRLLIPELVEYLD